MRNSFKANRKGYAWCGRPCSGTTLIELVVAIVLMAVVMGMVLPLFACLCRTWNTSQDTAEALQNGRVLMDHVYRTLIGAHRLYAVSDSSETHGYIQFEDNDGTALRYEIGPDGNVVYGQVGALAPLAGPVSQL